MARRPVPIKVKSKDLAQIGQLVHYTPKHGSWLNQAEIELSMYSRQCLGKRRFPDVGTLRRETTAWNRTAHRKRTKINWRFTRRKARKVFRYTKPRRAE